MFLYRIVIIKAYILILIVSFIYHNGISIPMTATSGIEINLEELEIKEIDFDFISKDAGIYFIFDKNKDIIYIGQSSSIKSRFNNHYNSSRWFVFIAYYYSIFLINNSNKRLLLETELIKKYNPICNNNSEVWIKRYINDIPKEDISGWKKSNNDWGLDWVNLGIGRLYERKE